MAQWRDDKLADLAKQLTYSPADKRAAQLAHAALLVHDIDPAKTYPWEFVLFRITGYRPKTPVDHTVPGDHLRADLSQLVEFLSNTLAIPPESAPEPVLLLEQVMAQFSVSSKTIQRWRRQGLLAQRYLYPDGRRRLGFLPSAVRGFASTNAQRIQRSALFRQLAPRERAYILRYARRCVNFCECSLTQVSERLARKLRRSPETMRYTLRKHDRTNPDNAIFPDLTDVLTAEDRQAILEDFDRGTSVKALAARYGRTRSSIYRLVSQQRAQRLKALAVDYVPNPLFDHPEADTIILDVLPREAAAATQGPDELPAEVLRMPRDLPAYLQDIFRQPVLAPALETDAFRRMNYLKAKARRLLQALDPAIATSSATAEIEALLAQANALKNQLVQANLRVAVHVARQHQRSSARGHQADVAELVSDASVWLLRAVERFDFARGVKFSTYASYAIAKNFARDRTEQLARPDARLVTGQEDLLSQLGTPETATVAEQLDATRATADLTRLLESLPERERDLLKSHFGLDPAAPRLSLAQLGEKLGLTKTRVRQLETRALRKLRRLLATPRAATA